MDRCPHPEQLQELLTERLSDTERESISLHVDGCRSCQEELERLTASTPVFGGSSLATLIPSDGFLRKLNDTTVPFRAGRPTTVALPNLPGFEIFGELGRGGMGIVFKARQTGLKRFVALKMVLANMRASDELRARFLNEAETVARLQHPNIVQVFEIGEHEGQPYFALELVDGGTLAHRLNGTPQPPAAAAALVETLARAIRTAHEQGVIHRDLKPSNILLASSGGRSGTRKEELLPASAAGHWLQDVTPKVADFGLAKLLDGDSELTRTGDLMGTPSYLAPEQAMVGPRSERLGRGIGPPTDVYALGVILYEMLTGRPPFKGETAVETVLLVLHQEPVSPSRLQPKVPQDLTTICLKCLEKESAKRYPTARELAEDLRRFLDDEPILARRVGLSGRLWRWARRRPVLAGLAASLVVSLVGGLIGSTTLWLLAESNRKTAETNASTAERRRVEAAAARERAEANLYLSHLAQAQLAWRLNDVIETRNQLDQCVPRPGEVDRRGWEWHYLKGLAYGGLADISTPYEHVQGLAFSSDGERLLIGGGDPYQAMPPGNLWSLDLLPALRTGRPLTLDHPLGEQRELVTSMAASPDGRLLAVGGWSGTTRLLDADTGRELLSLDATEGRVNGLAFDPDGARLAVAHGRGAVIVRETRTGAILYRLKGSWARFAPDGKHLLTAVDPPDSASPLEKWDAADGRARGRMSVGARHWEFSPDGRFIVAWNDRDVRVLDGATGRIVATLSGHTGDVRAAAFSPDGLHIATAGTDQTVRLWDAGTGFEELLLRGHTGRVGCLAFHPSGRYLASGGQQPGDVMIWDLTRHPEYLTVGGTTDFPRAGRRNTRHIPASALRFGDDGRNVLVAYRDRTIQAHDARGGPRTAPARWMAFNTDYQVPAAVMVFSADGGRLAAVRMNDSREVAIWDAATGRELRTLRGHTVRVFNLAWSRDGRRLATSGFDREETYRLREVKVWDTATGALLAEFRPTARPWSMGPRIYGLASLDAHGTRVAFDDYVVDESPDRPTRLVEARIQVRSADDGSDQGILRGISASPRAIVFSPDDRRIAYTNEDGQVMVHDLAAGRNLYPRPLKGPTMSADGLEFSPDGRLLAAVDREQVKVWDVRLGQDVLLLRGAPPRFADNAFNPRIAWSPDGQSLAALNHNLTISLWSGADSEGPSARFRAAEERAFTWHLAHASASVREPENRASAEFHFRILETLEPPSVELGLERAVVNVRSGRESLAADQYAEAHARQPFETPVRLHELALLRLRRGDLDDWRRATARLGELFDQTGDTAAAERYVRACLLAPDAVSDFGRMLRCADSDENDSTNFARKSVLRCAAHYRAGYLDEAVRHGETALREKAPEDLDVLARLMLAMAYARLGRIEPARRNLTAVETWLTARNAGLSEGGLLAVPPSVDWKVRMEAQILYPEAKAAVENVSSTAETREPS